MIATNRRIRFSIATSTSWTENILTPMLTLRCTKKLIKYLDSGPTSETPTETTTWVTGTPITFDTIELISRCALTRRPGTRTRCLCVTVPTHSLYILLPRRIRQTVLRLGFSDAVANQIDQEYASYLVAPTADRSVIGTMNDLIGLCEYMIDDECNFARAFDFNTVWYKLEDQLYQTPHKPLGFDNSRERCWD